MPQTEPMTAAVQRQARLRARHMGASGFLSKRTHPQKIMEALDHILAGDLHFDDAEEGDSIPGAESLSPRQLEVLDLLAGVEKLALCGISRLVVDGRQLGRLDPRRDRGQQLLEFVCAQNDRNPVDAQGNSTFTHE